MEFARNTKNLIPKLKSNKGLNGTAFTNNKFYGYKDAYDYFNGFGGRTSYEHLIVGYIFNKPTVVSQYSITENSYDLIEYVFEASHNTTTGLDGEWIVLDKDGFKDGDNKTKYKNTDNIKKFKAYRLRSTKKEDRGDMQFGYIKFFGPPSPLIIKQNNLSYFCNNNMYLLSKQPESLKEIYNLCDAYNITNPNNLLKYLDKKYICLIKSNKIYKSEICINLDEILEQITVNNNIIQYKCNKYKLIDLCKNNFEIEFYKRG